MTKHSRLQITSSFGTEHIFFSNIINSRVKREDVERGMEKLVLTQFLASSAIKYQ